MSFWSFETDFRLKFKSLTVRLKKKLAKTLLMLWMAFERDSYERELLKYAKAVDTWFQKWQSSLQSDAKSFLKETAKEKQEALKQRLVAVEKQHEQVVNEMVATMQSAFGALTTGGGGPSAELTLAKET